MTTKVCNKCNVEKPKSEFFKYKTNKGGLCHSCKVCHMAICKHRREEIRTENPMMLWAKDTLTISRQRAKKKGREHTITLEWLLANTNSICPLLNIPITYGAQKHDDHVASLDRKDPNKGYTPDNCTVISTRANRIKNDASLAELELITMNLRNYL
jgi:hypothetical protein